jgi:hypothetical protein
MQKRSPNSQKLMALSESDDYLLSKIDGKLQVDPNKLIAVDELLYEITKLFIPADGRETALLFFAGHGLTKPLGRLKQILLATSDANPRSRKWNGLLLRDLWK